MVFLDGQELGIPVHYASEEADNTRLGTSGPAVRAIVKETGGAMGWELDVGR